jgi:thiamine biosynthesis lipoprotein
MASPRSSTRRDFLSGQAAADALADLVDQSVAPAATPITPAPQDGYLLQIGRRAMACEFEVLLNAGQYPGASEAALRAFDLVDELEAQMSVYRETSEICHINRRAAEESVPVESRLFRLLEYAFQLNAQTQGAYDITSGPLSKVWGFYRRQGRLPEPDALAAALACVGGRHVQLDAQQQTIHFQRPGMELNLGSIGKGYALDRAAEVLAADGINDFLIHGGQSSILARGSRGPREEDGWLLSIGDPLRPGKQLAQVRLRNRAMGTSGSGTQFFRHAGRRYGHILDPRSGWPAEGVLSATAVAPTGAEADALATAFYVMGASATLEYCRRHPGVAALIVCPRPGQRGLETVSTGFAADELLLAADEQQLPSASEEP